MLRGENYKAKKQFQFYIRQRSQKVEKTTSRAYLAERFRGHENSKTTVKKITYKNIDRHRAKSAMDQIQD